MSPPTFACLVLVVANNVLSHFVCRWLLGRSLSGVDQVVKLDIQRYDVAVHVPELALKSSLIRAPRPKEDDGG